MFQIDACCVTLLNINGELLLLLCSKKREAVPDLAPMLWHSFGTIAALLQEIVNIYPAINPPNLTVTHDSFLAALCFKQIARLQSWSSQNHGLSFNLLVEIVSYVP